ncbi:mitochondrial zinc maintenance 1 mitochondrial [Fusarium subglutinans]|uniref:Mitochondrial zinc maintenance protein 1, mitochondrial n=1 Tax=Gibberella subglutinans TaxID=42677 RepID=A0A8H5L6I4_GIBSU|nr:mitochondrial zinc maintenance 1 mitochondrial [Fusarium subglutinans]KAF5585647.1 mitochondrial zinc maintenance 1 mitochondrial [Fusarium subglutinans]
MATAPAPALNAYRHLMRAARIAFQGSRLVQWVMLTDQFTAGDAPILTAAQLQIRNEFRQKASVDAADASAAIKHAEDVAKVLRQNVVQGQRTEEGKDTFKLRIHEDIERGDNESIKTAGKGTVGGGCCGGGGKK